REWKRRRRSEGWRTRRPRRIHVTWTGGVGSARRDETRNASSPSTSSLHPMQAHSSEPKRRGCMAKTDESASSERSKSEKRLQAVISVLGGERVDDVAARFGIPRSD